MRLTVLVFGSIFLAAISCSTEKKEPLNKEVEMKQLTVESMKGCTYDSMPCAQFDARYPYFKGLDSAVQMIIADRINYNLNNGVEGEIKPLNVRADQFIAEYNEFKAEAPDLLGRWYRTISVEVMTFSDSLMSLQVADESYEGGAHEAYNLSFVNVRPKDGSAFRLSDLLKPGYIDTLTIIGEQVFREVTEMADTSNYEISGYTFSDNKFSLNENYGFRSEGIVFYYNSYEIAPYSQGPTEIVIPYERIRRWIRMPMNQ